MSIRNKKWLIISFGIIVIFNQEIFSQSKFYIKGIVTDSLTNETLPGVTIFIKELSVGCLTDELGNYSLKLSKDIYTLEYRYLGYSAVIKKLKINRDTILSIALNKETLEIGEIVVTDSALEKQNRIISGAQRINIKSIDNVPTLLGEKDILKKVQMIPGIIPVEEGSSSIFVRGSSSDQTMIQLDGANIFNPSHIFGFISIFNPDIVKDLDIYKGGLPTQYGGKLSSLLDIRTKDGSFQNFHSEGGIGLLSGRIRANGPVIKNKMSYSVAARRSYSDLILKPFFRNIYNNYGYEFYDLNSKLTILTRKDKVSFSFYLGNDNFKIVQTNNSNRYGNIVVSNNWYHYINEKLSFKVISYYTRYNYTYELYESSSNHFNWTSNIQEISSKIALSQKIGFNNELTYGSVLSTDKIFAPELKYLDDGHSYSNSHLNENYFSRNSFIVSLFADHNYRIGKLNFNYGIRFNNYNLIGPIKIIRYSDENFPSFDNAIDTTKYKSNEHIKSYYTVEPRINIGFNINDNIIQLNYSKTSQFLQEVSGYTMAEPANIWVLSDTHIKPQIGNQVSVGLKKPFNHVYNLSFDVFYKWMDNQIDVKSSGDLYKNSFYETELRKGRAYAYGSEILFELNGRIINGWLSYTFLNSKRKISGINKDQYYSPIFDIRHTVSVVLDFVVNKRGTLSTNWVFHSGAAVTFPSVYSFEGITSLYYDPDLRNNDRMPNYHRLDLSYTLKNKNFNTAKFKSKWVFSVYNIYLKKNPYYYTFSETGNEKPVGINDWNHLEFINLNSKMLCLFYIIPSISYEFYF